MIVFLFLVMGAAGSYANKIKNCSNCNSNTNLLNEKNKKSSKSDLTNFKNKINEFYLCDDGYSYVHSIKFMGNNEVLYNFKDTRNDFIIKYYLR